MFYFAYGSNINQKDLNNYCSKHGHPIISLSDRSPQVAILKDYRLCFDHFSKTRKGGVADIEPTPGEYVEGVLFSMTDPDMQIISAKEGFHKIGDVRNIYTIQQVDVLLKPSDILRAAVTFRVEGNKKQEFTPPTREYLDIIIDGARNFGLSPDWIKKLHSFIK